MYRPGSALSKAKQKQQTQVGINVSSKQNEFKIPELKDYINKKDWVGAVAFLENEKSFSHMKAENNQWLAYAYFHNGDYKKAIQIYDEMIREKDYDKNYHVYKATCLYALCNYDEAKRECLKGLETPLQIRLMFHIAHKKNDEKNLMTYHHKIQESKEDQLCLAAIHYLRGHFEEASEIYRKLIVENRDYSAINVYSALCYYKLDYYDVSLDLLQIYKNAFPTSVIAQNLVACNQYQIYNGKAAEQELKVLQTNYEGENVFTDNDLLRHNLVVFRNGENALQVLPPLVEVFPEARLNLVIYYLKNDQYQEAYNLVKDMEATQLREHIIKGRFFTLGVVHAVRGQKTGNREDIRIAQNLFQLVGASSQEQDTIPGRQCMASCFFMLRQFDDVMIYLKSIQQFFESDDDFNWNYGITLAATGDYKSGEEILLKVQSEKYKTEDCYNRWLTRCYIMNGKPRQAWELYVNMETTNESIYLLQLIAQDCYKMGKRFYLGHFYYSVKAFDILERFDGENEYEDALKGGCVGLFQMVISGKAPLDQLQEAVEILKNDIPNNPQVEYIIKTINKWLKENND